MYRRTGHSSLANLHSYQLVSLFCAVLRQPIANLPYASKLLERHVSAQIRLHIQCNGIGDPFQSAYRPSHSVETAIVYIQDDVLRSLDALKHVALILLHLSAAFDTINHAILLTELHRIGVQYIAGSNLTSPAEHSASVSMTIFLALCDRNMELHRAVFWALSFSRCTSLDSRMFSPSTGSVIMSMRTTPSYTFIDFPRNDSPFAIDRIRRCVIIIQGWKLTEISH